MMYVKDIIIFQRKRDQQVITGDFCDLSPGAQGVFAPPDYLTQLYAGGIPAEKYKRLLKRHLERQPAVRGKIQELLDQGTTMVGLCSCPTERACLEIQALRSFVQKMKLENQMCVVCFGKARQVLSMILQFYFISQ